MSKQNEISSSNEGLDLNPKDQAYVSQHYQSSRHSMPSAAIDIAILQQAKAKQLVTPEPKRVTLLSTWRTWQFGGSIAASVVIVALVFSFMPSPSEHFIDDQAIVFAPPSSPSSSSINAVEASGVEEKPDAEPFIDVSQIKEDDELTMANFAVSDNAAVSLDAELDSKFENNKRKAESKLLAQRARLSLARKPATAQNANDLLAHLINIQTQLTLSHEEIMSVSPPEQTAQKELGEQMKEKELAEQGETSELTLQIANYKHTHAALLRALKENKHKGKDKDIDEKFKPVLSQEQWQKLMSDR